MPNILERFMAWKARESERTRILGRSGKGKQDYRAVTPTGTAQERVQHGTREAVRRVGEYKAALRTPERAMEILDKHANKNFVQRIMSPENYPRLYDNPGGETGPASTHSMAAEVDEEGNWHAFPTVIQQPDGNLKRLSRKDAQKHAKDTGERISFGKDRDDAIWFSSDEGYKSVWSRK